MLRLLVRSFLRVLRRKVFLLGLLVVVGAVVFLQGEVEEFVEELITAERLLVNRRMIEIKEARLGRRDVARHVEREVCEARGVGVGRVNVDGEGVLDSTTR